MSDETRRILDLLAKEVKDFETDPMTWMEIFLVELAGEMRLERAIPLIVKKLHECGEILSEQCDEALGKIEATFDKYFEEIRNKGREPAIEGLEGQVFMALRYQHVGDRFLARQRFDDIKEETLKEPSQRSWFLFAAVKTRDLTKELKDKPQDEKDRKKQVRKFVDNVIGQFGNPAIPHRDLRAAARRQPFRSERRNDK